MDEDHYILFRNGVPQEWARAAETVAKSTAISKPDVIKACRRGRGWIQIAMPKEKALAGAAALKAIGMEACAVSTSALIKPPAALNATAVFIENGNLRYQRDPKHTPENVPLAAIRILYAGYMMPGKKSPTTEAFELRKLEQQKNRDEASNLGTGLAVGAMLLGGPGALGLLGAKHLAESMDPRNEAPAEPSSKQAETCIDLVAANPLVRIRLRQRGFNYQCLGERRQQTLRANFKLLLNDLMAALPGALGLGAVNEAARGIDLENEKFLRDEADVDLEMSAILTGEALSWD